MENIHDGNMQVSQENALFRISCFVLFLFQLALSYHNMYKFKSRKKYYRTNKRNKKKLNITIYNLEFTAKSNIQSLHSKLYSSNL